MLWLHITVRYPSATSKPDCGAEICAIPGPKRPTAEFASLHCAPAAGASKALFATPTPEKSLVVNGNTGIDALRWVRARLLAEPHLAGRLVRIAAPFQGQKILAVTAHRRENLGPPAKAIHEALKVLTEDQNLAIILSLHPNPDIQQIMREVLRGLNNALLTDALTYPEFVHLLTISHIVLSDSCGIQEEAPALGKPTFVLHEKTERAEGIATGGAKLVGTDSNRICRRGSTVAWRPRCPCQNGAGAIALWRRLLRRQNVGALASQNRDVHLGVSDAPGHFCS